MIIYYTESYILRLNTVYFSEMYKLDIQFLSHITVKNNNKNKIGHLLDYVQKF